MPGRYHPPELKSWPLESWPSEHPPPWMRGDDLHECIRWGEQHGKRFSEEFKRQILFSEYGRLWRTPEELERDGRRRWRRGSDVGREVALLLAREHPELARRRQEHVKRALELAGIRGEPRKRVLRCMRGKLATGIAGVALHALKGELRERVIEALWKVPGADEDERAWLRLVEQHPEGDLHGKGRGKRGVGHRGRPPDLHPAAKAWFLAECMRQEKILGPSVRERRGSVQRLTPVEREAAKVVFRLADEDLKREYDQLHPPRGAYRLVLEVLRRSPLNRG